MKFKKNSLAARILFLTVDEIRWQFVITLFYRTAIKLLQLSPRTLQHYRDNGTIAYCKIGGKILYRQSDIQAMLERHYYPISKKQG